MQFYWHLLVQYNCNFLQSIYYRDKKEHTTKKKLSTKIVYQINNRKPKPGFGVQQANNWLSWRYYSNVLTSYQLSKALGMYYRWKYFNDKGCVPTEKVQYSTTLYYVYWVTQGPKWYGSEFGPNLDNIWIFF